ncbi:hypothetical protein OAK75_13565, partial [Bacteriovoracales bacterium]|nr:hypothetical protein [Bacteriovoracales bacterium]
SDMGYTPYGDDGIIGKDILLFNGSTGETNFLLPETGNLRLLNYHFHPIIRQRCLLTRVNEKKPFKKKGSIIHIESIENGFFKDEKVVLSSSIQTLEVDKKVFRLPPLKIQLEIEDLLHFKAFGENIVSEPASGCAKGLQRQLPITFNSHPAWCNLNESNIKISC